jgi:hypothetical protein
MYSAPGKRRRGDVEDRTTAENAKVTKYNDMFYAFFALKCCSLLWWRFLKCESYII